MVAIRVAPPPTGGLPLTAYPSASRRPMPETELHGLVTTDGKERLATHYEGRADVYVGGNIMVYYVEDNPRKVVSPDIFVALDVPKLPIRRSYYTWVDGPLTWAMEVISDSSYKRDQYAKRQIYRQMGVAEYFLYDPEEQHFQPGLKGYRLVNNRYRLIRPDRQGRVLARSLGLRFQLVAGRLHITVAATGVPLLLPEEIERRLRLQADARAEEAQRHAATLAAEIAELRRRLGDLPN